jgi:hypothetical protein
VQLKLEEKKLENGENEYYYLMYKDYFVGKRKVVNEK